MIDAEKATEGIIAWLQEQFRTSGGKYAVIGISGGKDSTVVAALCARALGKENVIGIILPNQRMKGMKTAFEIASLYCGKWTVYSIGPAYHHFTSWAGYNERTPKMERDIQWMRTYDFSLKEMEGYNPDLHVSDAAVTNLPARLRMCALYFVAQCVEHGRVINTSNLSERYVGYSTRYGDSVGDFSPLGNFTATEVLEIGKYLGVPQKYLDIPPSDGLSGLTDEENLGFTYSNLDGYIRHDGTEVPEEIRKKIDRLHELNEFKQKMMPIYEPTGEIFN